MIDKFSPSKEVLSSYDIFTWIQKVAILSHRTIKNTAEAGSCTASFFVITRVKNSADYLCCFASTGDVEAFYCTFDKETGKKKWQFLYKEPDEFSILRMDTSHTPGGLGGITLPIFVIF